MRGMEYLRLPDSCQLVQTKERKDSFYLEDKAPDDSCPLLPFENFLLHCSRSIKADHTQAGGGVYYAWGRSFMGSLGPICCGEQTMKAANYLNIIVIIKISHGICLPNWKWNLPVGQCPMSQGSIAGVVQEHTDEFHLMFLDHLTH
ncbi:hypothetical protein AVEN_188708-1 [Araneus ventricosus]|uniref:Uncharacterized protein n=1 Tax=Araneus ventricosus TaxID=182803 RepID=A0A4Y2D6Y3_ARAVE|nr:hypothetical protein AVEN_188708-1 [Araneus ventricosus]